MAGAGRVLDVHAQHTPTQVLISRMVQGMLPCPVDLSQGQPSVVLPLCSVNCVVGIMWFVGDEVALCFVLPLLFVLGPLPSSNTTTPTASVAQPSHPRPSLLPRTCGPRWLRPSVRCSLLASLVLSTLLRGLCSAVASQHLMGAFFWGPACLELVVPVRMKGVTEAPLGLHPLPSPGP